MKHHEHQQLDEATAQLWQEIQPHLHEALDGLSADDRDAVFTRFYQRNSYRDVAAVLRTTVDSARKRVSRALERRRAFFMKKGVLLSAAGLAGLAAGRHRPSRARRTRRDLPPAWLPAVPWLPPQPSCLRKQPSKPCSSPKTKSSGSPPDGRGARVVQL